MSFTVFSPTKFTRNFLAPTNAAKEVGGARRPTRGAHPKAAPSGIGHSANASVHEYVHPTHQTVEQVMDSDYVTVESSLTVSLAMDKLRVWAHVSERIYTIYVTGSDQRLDGVITLRDLLIADPQAPVSQVMSHPQVCITTDTFTERVHKIFQTAQLDQIPVIDEKACLVGIVTREAVKFTTTK